MSEDREGPVVTNYGILDMQVCVPKDWTDEQVVEFANKINPTEIDSKWQIRRAGDKALAGDPERVDCHERKGYVHMMLDC
jgi:hypothetical protein